MSIEQVWEAWGLSDKAWEFAAKGEKEVSFEETFNDVFVPSGLVDVERTKKEGGNPPKIYLKSPYGLQFNPETKRWIPFRHGPVKIKPP
jgi:hypothetical protein